MVGMLNHEMESIAGDVRQILESMSRREKFDLSTPDGWRDLLTASNSKPFAEQLSLEHRNKVRRLSLRWLLLYDELRFATDTRPVWNT